MHFLLSSILPRFPPKKGNICCFSRESRQQIGLKASIPANDFGAFFSGRPDNHRLIHKTRQPKTFCIRSNQQKHKIRSWGTKWHNPSLTSCEAISEQKPKTRRTHTESKPICPERSTTCCIHLVAPYRAIPRDYLSDTPLLRAMGFLVSQHDQLGAIPPPRFLSVSPLESMRSGGAIPPLKEGISAILARYPMKTRQTDCDTPLCDTISKGYCAIWGGISHWAAKCIHKGFLEKGFPS